MRTFLLCCLITGSCLALSVRTQILSNKPSLEPFYADVLARTIEAQADLQKVPANVIAAIMFVESSYDQYAFNKHTKDYGLMQISEFHVKKKRLDKRRLLRDIEYNIKYGVKIFSWFYRRYKLNRAIMRYNVGTRSSAISTRQAKTYLRLVRRAM